MKNKSKLKKIKEGKKTASMSGSWFLMIRCETGIEEIRNVLPKEADVEIWKEAGVIEIVLDEGHSIDIEQLETDLGDDYSNTYMNKNGVVSLYGLTFKAEVYELAKKYLDLLANAFDGFVCADTEDFKPEIGKKA